jgi:FtsZ-binding cell division protein ZapB
MISLEQVRLLETKIARAVEYVQKVTAENAALSSERAGLQSKLEANQKRIDELEVLVMRFKEDQGHIEDGIMAALNRLSQFEEAFENSLKEKATGKKPAPKTREKSSQPPVSETFFEISEEETEKNAEAHSDSSSAGELDIF